MRREFTFPWYATFFEMHLWQSSVPMISTALIFCDGMRGTHTVMSQPFFFFYPDPDPSSLIFGICQYRVPVRYLSLTNIFLDDTAALRKKSTCIQAVPYFFIFLKQSTYFRMAHAWYLGFKNSRWQRQACSSTTEMSWLSIAINLMSFSVIFYRTKWVVLNGAFLLRRCTTVVLQISTLQTLNPQVCSSNVTYASEFCHKLCSDLKKKKKNRPWVHVQNCHSMISGKIPISALIPILQIRSEHA